MKIMFGIFSVKVIEECDSIVFVSPSSSGLGHRPLTAAAGIRIP